MTQSNILMNTENLDASDPYVREAQTFPTLKDDQIGRLKKYGTVETFKKNDFLFQRGDRTVDFFVVISGNIEIFEYTNDGHKVFTIHRESQFTGEMDLLNDRKILVGGRMGEDGEVLRINRESFRRMLVGESDLSELIIRAFILRRVGLISHKQGGVTLIAHHENSDSVRIQRFLKSNGYPIDVIYCDDEGCDEILEKYQLDTSDLPSVIIHLGDNILKKPTNFQLAEALGLTEDPNLAEPYDVMIVGGGPTGLSAAVYAASEGLRTVLIEKEAPGGQAGTSSKIENYLGFPTGLSGQALAGRAQVQAMKFGAKIILPHQVNEIQKLEDEKLFSLELCNGTSIRTKSVIVTTGATYRRLNVKENTKFDNAGIYYAATAMEADICRGKEVIIVGGGNSAGQAAVFLAGAAKHVHMLVRRGELASSMSDYLIGRIESSPRITLHYHTEITELHGDEHLEKVTIKNRESCEENTMDVRHVFLMIGAVPNTEWLKECISLNDYGFALTGADAANDKGWPLERPPMMMETNVPGIFAAGDVRAGSIKRVASGVGEGSITVTQVHQYLAEIA
ncbi:MAG: FAD-dependent oxidoreductase [Pseudomonadota bacterium]